MLSYLIRLYVIFLYLHIGKHSHGWMNGNNFTSLIDFNNNYFDPSNLRYGMNIDQVREYERETFERTNKKVLQTSSSTADDNIVD